MKTVMEHGTVIRHYVCEESHTHSSPLDSNSSCYPKRSCFYDYGAPSNVEFTGFVNHGNSKLIDEITQHFKNKN